MQLDEETYLAHYGILKKSGRYPWGSGSNPLQRSKTFIDILAEHKKAGMSDAEIAKLYDDRDNGFPFTTSDLRAVKSRAVVMQKQDQIRTAQSLKDKGMGDSAIGRQMGINESTVRSLLEPGRLDHLSVTEETANMLKRQIAEKEMVDVGAHVEKDLPVGDTAGIAISKDKFNTALSMLKEEGYSVVNVPVNQVGTGETTTRRVLLKPGLTQKDAFLNQDKIQLISERTKDGGHTYQDMAFKKPLSINPKRVAVRYGDEGGKDADGVIYVRPGVKDIELGKSHYAQVRIAVGDSHFLKGMAIYKDDLPPGVDLMFNTNKSNTGNKLDALKKLEKLPLHDAKGNVVKDAKGKVVDSKDVDWKNPFGAFPKLIGGQILDERGNVTSAMNILNEQGDWDKWSKSLSAQMLSKQSPKLINEQLGLTHKRRLEEFDEIKSLTNPLIKKRLLESFADETDSAAVHLKAAAMPHQATKVILPVKSLKEHEVFAPTFNNGDRLALVRFPHAGTFEIPELTVNNQNREARKLFGQGKKLEIPDAIGIHPKVAEHLSGADFDGDTVVVIPNHNKKITNRKPLEGLKDFDPQKYKVDESLGKTITNSRKQDEMGKITNLISDMTIRGANDAELARAVRHSMVVIDAEKHNLDYKASEKDHAIIALKKKYQGREGDGPNVIRGASTLITRASSEARPFKRKDALLTVDGVKRKGLTRLSNATVDNKTGKKVYDLTGETNKKGELKTFRSRKLAETDDAFTLVSEHGGWPVERMYAEHSNRLKGLANEVRKETIAVPKFERSPSAAKVYKTEVDQLKAKLNTAQKNAPLERQAQTLANEIVSQRRRANPTMEKSDLKKIKGQALNEARARTGAKKHRVEITDREWLAIQNHAISAEMLGKILQNTDMDKLRDRATPRVKPVMTSTRTSRAKAMLGQGFTYAEVAERLGVPVSTLKSSIDGGETDGA